MDLKNGFRNVETDCRNRLHVWLLRIVGALSKLHVDGTLVPVEEPSTASETDISLHRRHASNDAGILRLLILEIALSSFRLAAGHLRPPGRYAFWRWPDWLSYHSARDRGTRILGRHYTCGLDAIFPVSYLRTLRTTEHSRHVHAVHTVLSHE
jgi:hypothetical protein